jgi:hypothetical protein
MEELNYEASRYLRDIPFKLWTSCYFPWPRYDAWRDIRTSIWSYIMKTVYDRRIRPQMGHAIADIPWNKFQERLKESHRFRVFESGNSIYQVQIPDTGYKFTVNLRTFECSCINFWEHQAPCSHAICAAR